MDAASGVANQLTRSLVASIQSAVSEDAKIIGSSFDFVILPFKILVEVTELSLSSAVSTVFEAI